MIEISKHAREEMISGDISEEEVKACIEHGEREIKQIVDGEPRYGNKLISKDKIIMTIYTYSGENIKIITCYPIWRKKIWENK